MHLSLPRRRCTYYGCGSIPKLGPNMNMPVLGHTVASEGDSSWTGMVDDVGKTPSLSLSLSLPPSLSLSLSLSLPPFLARALALSLSFARWEPQSSCYSTDLRLQSRACRCVTHDASNIFLHCVWKLPLQQTVELSGQ
eukprot:COSAG02_NODE_491_length_21224_cov_5.973680_19_plen_138_part_00